ncbi:MAG: hypothetical protein KDI13_10555 [Alphaproteobacteria bacterium]|nr:hypothetical protein [Alphaproteobacteria bacterium]
MTSSFVHARTFIERHFTLVLLMAFVIGLTAPGLSSIPKYAVPVILASIILFSCSKITLQDFKTFRLRDVIGFYLLRFCVLPAILFLISSLILPGYTYALFLLALLPCGATLPALMTIMGGKPALGLSATTLTSALAPLTIPLAFMLVGSTNIEIDILGMFKTLLLMIICPVVIYFSTLRRFSTIANTMRTNASAASCLLISGVVALVMSYQQDRFFEDPELLVISIIIGLCAYFIFYASGWFFSRSHERSSQISYALMGGNNNIGLGISLAVLYFPPHESLILILWEITWIISMSAFQTFLKKQAQAL